MILLFATGALIGAMLWMAFSGTKESYSYQKERTITLKRYPDGRVERYENEDFEEWEF